MINFLFAAVMTILASISIVPSMMSIMMFDSPGSHRRIMLWISLAGIAIWNLGCWILVVWSWGSVLKLTQHPPYMSVVYLFIFCAAPIAILFFSESASLRKAKK